ncbi:MAG TPA: glycerate kinase [Jatrophihabitans sp.]
MLIAPDKFKGTLTATEAARAIADGWHQIRPEDDLTLLPMADGGDGTASVLAEVLPDPQWVRVAAVDAIGRPHPGRYLRSHDTAVVELAEICGIALLDELQPMSSHTIGLGIVIAAALRAGVSRILIAPAGSASTDGGTGALAALGARFRGRDGLLPVGGEGLSSLVGVALDGLETLPEKGVDVLVDVDAPLYGPSGAAFVFGPQKGASDEQVAELDAGLRQLASVLGGEPEAPGAGAAGGVGYGLACWGARLVAGAEEIARLIGLDDVAREADVVITGEGRFDDTSLSGKACGHVLAVAGGVAGGGRGYVIAGSVADNQRGSHALDLTELAGSSDAARSDPARWLTQAAGDLARRDFGPR